jgi:predicted  nucleic acid-binding Zn-ribbon protein
MNEQKLKNFIALVTFDQSLTDIAQKVQTSNSTTQKFQTQLQQLEKDLEIRAHKKSEIETQLHEQELKVKELQDQESHLIVSSQSVATAHEYDAANKEIDRVKFNRDQQEQKMMQMINKVAAAQKEYQTFHDTYQTDKEKLLVLIDQEKNTVKSLHDQMEQLHQQRQSKLLDIPQEWLDVYETMRGRVNNPVVPVNQDSCSACFYFMAARDIQLLKNQGLLQCKDCYRFLYHEQS